MKKPTFNREKKVLYIESQSNMSLSGEKVCPVFLQWKNVDSSIRFLMEGFFFLSKANLLCIISF